MYITDPNLCEMLLHRVGYELWPKAASRAEHQRILWYQLLRDGDNYKAVVRLVQSF